MKAHTKRPVFSAASILFSSLSVLCLVLAVYELPRNDGVNGYYLNIMFRFVGDHSPSAAELRALSPFAITEARIVTGLYVVAMLAALGAVFAGLKARWRRESSALYAGPVVIALMLLIVGSEYAWLLVW